MVYAEKSQDDPCISIYSCRRYPNNIITCSYLYRVMCMGVVLYHHPNFVFYFANDIPTF